MYNAKIVCLGKGLWNNACVKMTFSFSFQYTHGVVHWLSWPHDTLPYYVS